MLLLSERLLDLPILSLQTGSPLAYTTAPIIDPRRLHIVAFYCDGPNVDTHPAIVHTEDIREFSELGLIVDDSNAIMPPDGLVRLEEILAFNFEFIGLKVIDNHNTKLGKVSDYIIDADSFLIHKFTVKRPLLKSLHDSELTIDRSQIVEITDDAVIVRAPSIKAEVKSIRPVIETPQFENPFRAPGTQPEV